MKTIGDQWQSYADDVMPKDASLRQVIECRRAFYAGAQAAYGLSLEIAALNDSEALTALARFRTDLDQFAGRVATGEA